MNKIYHKWKQFDIDVSYIISFIKDSKWNIRAIYGIPKGGLVLGVTLANILDIPLFTTLRTLQSRMYDKNKILIVDDISDSGKTLIGIKDITEYKTITLFIKEGTKFMPDKHLHKCPKDKWAVFPWEENPYVKNITITKKGYESD